MMNAAISRLMPDNPVMTKEMRVRMRGSRAYWLMFGYIGFLALVMLLTYWGWLQSAGEYGGYSRVSQLGTQLYLAIYLTQVCLALIITPAITSGSITLEKEQRTLEMLAMTRLPLPRIVLGKLLSGVLFTGLLLVTSLPLVSLTFTFGGVDPAMVFTTYLILFTATFLMGALGVMWSSIAAATTQAVIYTYFSGIVIALAGGLLYTGFEAHRYSGSGPFAALVYAVSVNWFGGRFLGFNVPEGVGFGVSALLIGAIFVRVAVSRLEAKPERQAWHLRGLVTLFFGIQIYSAFREIFAACSQSLLVKNGVVQSGELRGVPEALLPSRLALLLPALLLMLLVPVFCTGERSRAQQNTGDRFFWKGFSLAGLREGCFNSGLPFMLGLGALSIGLFYAAGLRGLSPAAPVALLFALFGFGRVCQFLSCLFRNRWASWLFGTLMYAYLAGVPLIAAQCYSANQTPPFGFFINAAYLDPSAAIFHLINPLVGDYLAFHALPVWKVLIVSWALISILAGLGIERLSQKSRAGSLLPRSAGR